MSRLATPGASVSTAASSSGVSVAPGPSLFLQLSQLRQPYNAVPGVYLLPSTASPRAFHGLLFLHEGPYAGAIFPFHLELPREALLSSLTASHPSKPTRPTTAAPPKLTFTQPIPHPLVHPHTHQLRLTRHFPTWDPSNPLHTLPHLLRTLKSLFQSTQALQSITRNEASNTEIWTLFHSNEALFGKLVGQAVQHSASKSALYGNTRVEDGKEGGGSEEEDDVERREGFAFRELKDDEYERLKREILGS